MNTSADPSLQQGERVREHLPRGRRPSKRKTTGSLPSFIIFLHAGSCSAFFLHRSERDVRPSDQARREAFPSFRPYCHGVKAWRRMLFPELAAALGILLKPFRKRREVSLNMLSHCISQVGLLTTGVGGSGRKPFNPARGPLAVSLPYGSSLLSVGERGRAPCRRPPRVAKNCRVLRCFVLFAFFPIFRILWFKMGQHGPT